jgi:DNA-binding response OmpR family regulator
MRQRIMVVDDEEVMGRMLLYQLQEFGYEATYLQDGIQALERMLAERPDLILLDVMMPQISGWEVCREVRAVSDVPIIMLTAKDADADVVAGLAAGADDYVTKPFNMAQLKARIEAVLRRRPRAAEPALAPRPAQPSPTPLSTPTLALAGVPAQVALPTPLPVMAAPTVAQPRLQSLGKRMKQERQARSLSLYQAERLCRIRWDFLQALEQDNSEYVPAALRETALQTYASFLRIDLREYRTPVQHHWIDDLLVVVAVVLLLLLLIGGGALMVGMIL